MGDFQKNTDGCEFPFETGESTTLIIENGTLLDTVDNLSIDTDY
jgi:hypothetical protein